MPYKRNTRTGAIVEVDARGVPVSAAPPRDPTFDFKGPQAAAGLGQTQAATGHTIVDTRKTQQEIQQSAALFQAQKAEAEAKARIAQMQAAAAEAENRSKSALNPQQLQGASEDAMSKLRTIDRIRGNIGSAWLPAVGLGAETAASIGGTNARNVQADIGSLKAGGALSEVLKMSRETGKNPFTPMSNSDVELVARNTANLDQGQSRPNFNSNLNNYQQAYTKAYAGSEGMRALNGEIDRMLPTIAPEKREAFKQDALRRYNELMAAQQLGAAKRRPRPRANSGAKFLGWED